MKALNMKKINIWMFALASIVMAWACEEKENMDPVGNWDLSVPTPQAPAANASVVLDVNAPDSTMTFEWTPAVTTNRFGIDYTFLLLPKGTDDYENALLRIEPGRESFVAPTAAELDYALWAACYPTGSAVELQWVVIAKALDKQTVASQNITVNRFDSEYIPPTLFIYGPGTEAGEDVANAAPMRPHTDADGNTTGVYDVYTTLTAGGTYNFRDQAQAQSGTYGGADGALSVCGPPITVAETGQYRVTVDLNNNTYELLHIDRWSLVGDAVEGGWGGDVPLAYKGNGVWQGEVEFLSESGFIFRANGDWAYLLKRIKGTASGDNKGGELVMESEAPASGIQFEDIPGTLGLHTVTLTLAADGYTYTLIEVEEEPVPLTLIGESTNPTGDAVAGNVNIADIATPDAVFLISEGAVVAEFTKNGDVFSSGKYIAMEAGKIFTLNTASDGSGEEIIVGNVSVARDQAYNISIDFVSGKLTWKYYNMKLFHWDEVGGGWDARTESVMTYVHPYTFEVTANLTAGYHSKFNSPWEVQFGTDAAALTGTMTNGGANYTGITQSGEYKATIVVSDDYTTAEYKFVKQ